MTVPHSREPGRTPHHARIWRWVAFDPPMRDPAGMGCRTRQVTCTSCRCDLGRTDDPLDAFMIAWRHRKQLRRPPSMGTAAG
jgi:hypothetical protein